MKIKYLLTLILAAGFTSISAAPPPKPPQDVNVVNAPNVTVTNPQTSVTVDNGIDNPVPVTGYVNVGNTSPIPVSFQQTTNAEYEFVGYSSEAVNSDRLGYQSEVCRNTFGPLARWATTSEVREAFELGTFTQLPAHIATIRSEYSHFVWDNYNNRTLAFEPHAELLVGGDSLIGCDRVINRTVNLFPSGNFIYGYCYSSSTTSILVAACSLPK